MHKSPSPARTLFIGLILYHVFFTGCTDEALRASPELIDKASYADGPGTESNAGQLDTESGLTPQSPDRTTRSGENVSATTARAEAEASDTSKKHGADEPCNDGTDCQSGVCEGRGCGDNEGRCAPEKRSCYRDWVAFCGCDGNTFRAASNCTRRRYRDRGTCP